MSEFVRCVGQLPKPVVSRLEQLDIELTERCNNNCVHCCINRPANDADARQRETTTVQIKDILTQAADLGCLQVRFTGGEPLLRPDFEELYLFARRLGMRVLLFTNARLITPHLADLFAHIRPLVPIEVSVYGMCRDSYEGVTRSQGSFAQFQRGMNLLSERNIAHIVKSAFLPQNKHEIDQFETWAKTIPWTTCRPGYAMFFDLRYRRDDTEKNRLIESLRVSPQEGLVMYLRDPAKHGKWTRELASKLLRPPGARLFNCGACKGRYACVDAYGRAQPCMAIRVPDLTYDVVGLTEHDHVSLRDALTEFTHLREVSATNLDYLRRCAVCFLKGVCEQCPAKSWAEHGTLDTPVEYVCQVTHMMARYLGWLDEDEHGWETVDGWERVK